MSSAEEENSNRNKSGTGKGVTRRRLQRACDVCRRKKVRCDGDQTLGSRCSSCIAHNCDCTYIEAVKNPPKGHVMAPETRRYIGNLETRLRNMEELLRKLRPDIDLTQELSASAEGETSPFNQDPKQKSNSSKTTRVLKTPVREPTSIELESSDDESRAHRGLTRSLERMKLDQDPAMYMGFFGKSSSVLFVRAAHSAKHEYTSGKEGNSELGEGENQAKRHRMWNTHPWIASSMQPEKPHQEFPPNDLLSSLIDLYFENVNYYYPLLHRPTFLRDMKNGLHFSHEAFGSIVLLVCAIGSKFSVDPRVILEGTDSLHSCGWKYFMQVQSIHRTVLSPPNLYDLQHCFLTCIYLSGTSALQACWVSVGVGIRIAQDVGVHRRKVYYKTPTVEDELWKRAFWCLVTVDRFLSVALGRPCAIQEEDFDVELPTECDDEYWVIKNNTLEFNQPPGKPSKVAFFNCLQRLNQIQAFALRTIYAIKKSKVLLGFGGQQWEQHIVTELDSALNKWIDSVPDHLRWDPNREDLLFFNQSSHLYSQYYQLQIAVHRPFIPSARKPSPLPFPSLAICTNAARSCTHVLDAPFKRLGKITMYHQVALFTSATVLLLNIWSGKRLGLTTDPVDQMGDIRKCMDMLQYLETRWPTAGRFWDILNELTCVTELPSHIPSNKRRREEESSHPSNVVDTSDPGFPVPVEPAMSRQISGTDRISQLEAEAPGQHSGSSHPNHHPIPSFSPAHGKLTSSNSYGLDFIESNFTLPIHTDELGQIPIHPGLSNSDPLLTGGWYGGLQDPSMGAPGTSPQTANLGNNASTGPPIDSALEAMFSMPFFEEMMSSLSSPGVATQTSGVGSGDGVASLGGGDLVPNHNDATTSMQPASFANGWMGPNPPFRWEDWGSYMTNVTGPYPHEPQS